MSSSPDAQIRYLTAENKALRKAARLIFLRGNGSVPSGSLQMGDIDAFCKSLDLNVWEWPRGNFWEDIK